MTVKELIEILQEVEDKSKPIFIYDVEQSELKNITLIDTDISDRVDINI